MGSSGGSGTSRVVSEPAPFEIPEEFKPLVESAVKEIVATQQALLVAVGYSALTEIVGR